MTTESKVDEFDQEDLERESLLKESFTFSGKLPDVVNTEQEIFLEQFGEATESQSAEEQIEQYGWDSKLQTSVLIEKAKEGDQKAKHILKMREFRRKFAIINYSGKTFVQSRNSKGEIQFQDFKSFKEYFLNEWYEWEIEDERGKAKLKKFFVADDFLRDKFVKKYEGMEFAPENGNSNYLNLWKGWNFQGKQGNIDLFLELINSLCDWDSGCANYLLNYMAHMIQKPTEKPEVAIVLQGSQGIGKGTLFKIISKFNNNYKHLSSIDSIAGNFSGHLLEAFIVVIDEAIFGGNKVFEGRLKNLISEPYISIRSLHKDEIQIRSYMRIFIASNEAWAVPVGEADRRYFILNCSDKYKGQTEPHQFFGKINRWIDEGGSEYVFHFLKNRDISEFNPRSFPKTDARIDMQKLSLNTATRFIYELLEGNVLLTDGCMTTEGVSKRFKRNMLYQDLLHWCKLNNKQYPPTTDEFGKTIARTLDFNKDNPNWKTSWCKKVENKNEYFYKLNSFAEAQERFSKTIFESEASKVFFNYDQYKEDLEKFLKDKE